MTKDRKEAPCLRPARGVGRWPRAGPQSVLKFPQLGVKSRHFGASRADKETTCFAGTLWSAQIANALLAMQKVVGSNPFSRSRKACILQVLFADAVGRSGSQNHEKAARKRTLLNE